ncbi:TetR/AcrR family transcriptional regulator [Phaeobacter sp. A36a-5a]|uniref:TetR/AcrR family transcriptional regulator n=1 Tax=Phaeobacter bryozoorum TaxID=1086632 RepID=UPI0030CA09F1
MASKAEIRKQELREKLVAAAEIRIRRDGAGALRARDLATDAGCAVGAIYNAFDDMNAIVMAVNGRTFQALGLAVQRSLVGAQTQAPTDRLILMSHAYLGFAAENTRLWRALFDVRAEEVEVPDWYRAALEKLFANIAAPVAEIFPDKAPEDLALMVRALFSAVHGIVLLGLESRISGVPIAKIERMISEVLSRLA